MSLFSSLNASADSLLVLDRSLEVAQNNVTNASTPGYARQIQGLASLPFDPERGLSGGVWAVDLATTRDHYAEAAVRRENSSLGNFQQQATSLAPIESAFDISGKAGIPATINALLTSFANWSSNVNDNTGRTLVIERARDTARSFQEVAGTLSRTAAETGFQFRSMVTQINNLAGRVLQYNLDRNGTQTADAGLDANLHAALEDLSELAEVTVSKEADGSYTVLLGGQVPLVMGARQYEIRADVSVPDSPPPVYPSAPPTLRVLDSSGAEITSKVNSGKLAGLIETNNVTLAGLLGDGSQPGDLNRMAMAFADRVNQLLAEGTTADGSPGSPLFEYDSDPIKAAATLAVTGITPGELAAVEVGPPTVANGTALKLAALGRAEVDEDKIDGLSFVQFFGDMAAKVGSRLSAANQGRDVQKQAVAQAREFREQISGVSLDEEAIRVMQFQRSYQATAKMITVLDSLTETLVNLLQ